MLGKSLIKAATGAGGAAGAALYIEDVMSTWLYTGNGSTQTITNGIDLAGEGGLVWAKSRSSATDHQLFDTARGATKKLISNSNAAEATDADTLTAFNADGFDLGADANINTNAATYASWTFRKAEKFFDVVTYTGDGVAGRTVAHNLGSVPGCIIIKRLNLETNWPVYHRSVGNTDFLILNENNSLIGQTRWNNTDPTSTDFTLSDSLDVNASGGTYVAYLFAHDAGGFGDDGTESVIKCGSYTGNGSTTGPVIDLGWEPQWILIKRTDAPDFWEIIDAARGMTVGGTDNRLQANTTGSEITTLDALSPTSTGFQLVTFDGGFNSNNATYIYIAIRRGPMKTPTSGTEVFSVNAQAGTGFVTTNFPVDFALFRYRAISSFDTQARSRLTGAQRYLLTNRTLAEQANIAPAGLQFDSNTGVEDDALGSSSTIYWTFRRAPGFFDVVAYTGTGVARTVSHNLGVAPELMIVKRRNGVSSPWAIYHQQLGPTKWLEFTDGSSLTLTAYWNDTSPAASFFTVGTSGVVNDSAYRHIAYLFATCPGVSKVGSYTGTGTTLDVDCSFTAGARFVLIKRTDSTGDWYVWDSARGIISGNDPYLLLNSAAAEVTSTDYIDPYSAGFEISSTAPAAINASGGSFIYLAIA